MSTLIPARQSPLRRPRTRGGRPFARLRRFCGTHLTAFRLVAGGVALAVGLSLPPGTNAVGLEPPIPGATEPAPERELFLTDGLVAIAVARSASTPDLVAGDVVHAIVITDPLIAGETRPPAIAVRDITVVASDDTSITIAVDETQAPALVQATLEGAVVLARTE